MTLNELAASAGDNEQSKGFLAPTWRPEHEIAVAATVAEKLCLIHSEVSEALEVYRKAKSLEDLRAEPFTSELADIVIRTAALARMLAIDLDAAVVAKLAKNALRPYRHGDKII